MVSHVNVLLEQNFKSLMESNVVLIYRNVKLDNIIVAGCHAVIFVLMDHPMVFKGMLGGMKIIHSAFTGKSYLSGFCDKCVTNL